MSKELSRVIVGFCMLACFPDLVAGRDGASVGELEERLRRAVAAGQPAEAIECLNELARTGEVRAYQAIIDHGLSSESYDIERHAGKLLVSAASPAALRLILSETGSHRDHRTRIVLLAVVARWAALSKREGPEPSKLSQLALGVLHDALEDRVRTVALTAIEWIRYVGSRESIDPLIERLESLEKLRRRARVYFDILNALKALSGHDFKLAADWRNWWEVAKDSPERRAEPDSKQRKARKRRTVLYREPPSFFSVPVQSDRVLFVIDVSQSMLVKDPELPPDPAELADGEERGSARTAVVKEDEARGEVADSPPGVLPQSRERLFRVKEELMKVIKGLPETTRFGILSFSHELRFWGGASALRDATPSRRADALGWVSNLQAYGATRTDLALAQALTVPEVDTIYLLTDGRPRNEYNQKISVDAILRMVKRENRFRRCRIHTISFLQVKSSRMKYFVKELAKQNDGVCTLLR